MVDETSTCRGDEQPDSTRCQTANWTKNSVRDIVLCLVVSLRLAIKKAAKKAAQFAAHVPEIVALMCRGRADIVVSSGQAWNFPSLPVEPQVSQWPRVTANIIETADGYHGPLLALMSNGAVYREATVYNAMSRK
jgi:hypothetical protein